MLHRTTSSEGSEKSGFPGPTLFMSQVSRRCYIAAE
ncbi:hypothetical protein PAMH27_3553 [Pseudomonas aeruginosa MH27]|nr:hypothetical protein PAMH27_3553 [Pseudomonas aeruginosa MH27]